MPGAFMPEAQCLREHLQVTDALTLEDGEEGRQQQAVLCAADLAHREDEPVQRDLDAQQHQQRGEEEVWQVLDDLSGRHKPVLSSA